MPLLVNYYRIASNIGNCIAENIISLARVGVKPINSPPSPLFFLIVAKLYQIRSDRPTIICCFTTSKGFRTRLATISAHTEAITLPA